MRISRIGNLSLRSAIGAALLAGLCGADESMPFSPALPPPLGRIEITAGSADPVQVFVDGELQTDRTPATITVPAGAVTLLLRRTGYADHEETLNVEPLETVTLQTEMTPQ